MTDQPGNAKPTMPSGPSFFGVQMPEKLGSYRLESVLGKGGMGLVIKAWDENLDRAVALKVISKDYLQHEDSLVRLQSEAKSAAQMVHQNIVSVYSYGKEGEWPYIAMEYVEGQDLSAWVKKNGPMQPEKAIGYIRQAAEALSYAANRSVVHRDIKPANLMLGNDGTLKVMDFGIAKRIDIDMGLTASGAILGTPDYMSPEQTLGHKLDFRSDMYSLGLTLFTLINGMKPFVGDTPFKVMNSHVNEPLPIPQEWSALASGRLVPVLMKMTAKDPDERYDSWDSLINELYQIEVSLYGSDSVSAPRTVAPSADSFSQPVKPKKKSGGGLKVFTVVALLLAAFAVVAGGAVMLLKGKETPFPPKKSYDPDNSAQVSSVAPKISYTSVKKVDPGPPPSPAPTPYPTPVATSMKELNQRVVFQQPVPRGSGRGNQAGGPPAPPVGMFLSTLNEKNTFIHLMLNGEFDKARQEMKNRTPLSGPRERAVQQLENWIDKVLESAQVLDKYLQPSMPSNPTREDRLRAAEQYLKTNITEGTEKQQMAGLIYLWVMGAENASGYEDVIRQNNSQFPTQRVHRPLLETARLLHQEMRNSLRK